MSSSGLAMAAGIAARKRKDPPGTRYDGAETSRRNRSVPGHRCASGQKPAESHTNFHTNNQRRRHANLNRHRLEDRSAGCRTAHQTYADAVRQRNPPPPQKGRSHPLNVQRHFRELFKAPSAQPPRGACVCVLRDTTTPPCVASTCTVTFCVLRGQRKGPFRLSIGSAMVACKDYQRRCETRCE